jgi:4-hydroxythreonine-4-phosphate dehydrogenase
MPHIILTPGDPTGIGPEITVKALQRLVDEPQMRITVIGSVEALERSARSLKLPLPQSDNIVFHAIEGEQVGSIAYRSIETAVEMIAAESPPQLREGQRPSKEAQADMPVLVTGPISKRNLAEAGYAFGGHTEILEHLAQRLFNAPDARAEMLFVYKNLRLLLLTRHIAIKDVSAALSVKGAVARPIKTLIAYLRHHLGISEPNLAMLGLNPHAGEIGGGEEEKTFFMPVIHAVNAIGASRIDGPVAADAFFRGFTLETLRHDAIIAPYHDQGLIPFKMLAGYEAVNVTIGLPFLRTSVSHGTAEDIAGKGIAREDSLMAAIEVASGISR